MGPRLEPVEVRGYTRPKCLGRLETLSVELKVLLVRFQVGVGCERGWRRYELAFTRKSLMVFFHLYFTKEKIVYSFFK